MARNNQRNRDNRGGSDRGSLADQLAALGLATEEQVRAVEREHQKRDQKQEQSRQQRYNDLSRRDNTNNRGRGGYSNSNRGNRNGFTQGSPSTAGMIYGEVKDIRAAAKPADIATAPYNFIPLPDQVMPSELDGVLGGLLADGGGWVSNLEKEQKKVLKQRFHEFRFGGERYSGAIELDMKALTSLFVGGNGSDMFAPSGKPMIPGSTVRGVVKNLFKMITCGTWEKGEDLTGNHLYYRCLMSTGRTPQNHILRDIYKERMTSTDEAGKIKRLAKPGFLVQVGSRYRIYPTIEDREHSIVIKEYKEKFRADISKSLVRWDGDIAYVQVGLISARARDNIRSRAEIEEFMRVTPASRRNEIGKQYYRYMDIKELNKAKYYEVSDEVIEEYKNDKNRGGVNLIESKKYVVGNMPKQVNGLEAFKSIIPCYYLMENGQVSAFGHGQSFRVAYRNSIMDAVPDGVKQPVVDFASAVFGRSLGAVSWASRVAFDDAKLVSTIRCDEKAKAHALMRPNPTSIQLYLKQDDNDKLVHWESMGAKVRGYKMYWHHPQMDWKATDREKTLIEGTRNDNQGDILKQIQPLQKDSEFKGRIRFRDLTACELGALLKVFNVVGENGQAAYKLGMGKSIGLGSVSITPHLLLENGSRYEKLFEGGKLNDSLSDKADPQKFIQVFEEYVKSKGMNTAYRDTVKNLSMMLDFKKTTLKYWHGAVSAIDGTTNDRNAVNPDKRFALRSILPEVGKVVERAGKPM